jgi:hypothetical protein
LAEPAVPWRRPRATRCWRSPAASSWPAGGSTCGRSPPINRGLAGSFALRRFLEQERESALRTLTSSGGIVEPRSVAVVADLIEAEVHSGAYDPPVEAATLAYAIVGLANAFLHNDAVAGIRGDVDRLRDVEAALLGVGR